MHTQEAADEALVATLDRAVEFLLSRQLPDGCWTDWMLPPGPSQAWTTAYVGTQLSSGPPEQRARARRAVASAAQWLAARVCAEGGWSYNDRVDVDADSTACAIAFLRAAGCPVGAETFQCLTRFQQPDGGFATYAADAGLGSWGRSHVEVSAAAVQALIEDPTHQAVCERALRYLRAERRPDGVWDAFWWVTPLYATAACLRLTTAIDAVDDASVISATLRTMQVVEAFETALLLECLVHGRRIAGSKDMSFPVANERLDALVASLVARQLPDGSWASVPILRVTDRACEAPTEESPCGLVYADPERLFTSATVLRALKSVVDCRRGA